jgi:dCMP deaminase
MIQTDHGFLDDASNMATASTCDRARVGCVLVAYGQIVGLGYNGAPTGQPDCDLVGHLMIDGHCKRTIHAEARALLWAARFGKDVGLATAYITHAPCIDCANLLIYAGVRRVVYGREYGDGAGVEQLRRAGVMVELVERTETERVAAHESRTIIKNKYSGITCPAMGFQKRG